MNFDIDEEMFDSILPQGSYAAIRVDGNNFSKFTKEMRKDSPFNKDFTKRMLNVAKILMERVDGAVAVFVQSDEVSVIFQDLQNENSQKWNGGRVHKIVSLSSALSSVAFNEGTDDMAIFDSRVFDLGDDVFSVVNYLTRRWRNGVNNSVGMLSSFSFSHKQLTGVGVEDRKKMLEDIGESWDNIDPVFKYGTLFLKKNIEKTVSYVVRGETQETTVKRPVWVSTIPENGWDDFEAIFSTVS